MKENGIKLDLLEQILTEPCERKVVEICMDAFKDLIPGDYYSVLYCNLATREIDSFQNGTGWLGTTHPLMKTVREKFTQHPLTRNFLTHRQSGAYVRSDLVSDHLWKRSEIYHEVDRPMGIEDMATIYQVTGSGCRQSLP